MNRKQLQRLVKAAAKGKQEELGLRQKCNFSTRGIVSPEANYAIGGDGEYIVKSPPSEIRKMNEDIFNRLSKGRSTSKSIFLIEKAWFDPLENRVAHGYEVHSFVNSKVEAEQIVIEGGHFTEKDSWSIGLLPGKKLPKFRYKEIGYWS